MLPDIIIYPINDAARKAYTGQDNDNANSVNDNTAKDKGKQVASEDDENLEETKDITEREALAQKRKPFRGHISWDHMLLMIEVKADSSTRPFGSESEDIRPVGDERKKSRGQLAEYITAMLSHQHLLFAFQVQIYRCEVRLLRWDRSGVLISKPFNILGKYSPLHRFLFRFSKMSDVECGADLTASLASTKEITLMKDCFRDSKFPKSIKQRFALATMPNCPIYKLKFLPEHYPKTTPECDRMERDFIVGGTDFFSPSPTGRATKNYIAYDVMGKRIIYLKDTWRTLDT